MPESVKDRPTKAHEYIFLLTKSKRYYYDHEAVKEPVTGNAHSRGDGVNPKCAGWMDGPGSHSAKDHARAKSGLKDSTKFGRGAGWSNNGVGFGHGYDADTKPRDCYPTVTDRDVEKNPRFNPNRPPRSRQNPSFFAATAELVSRRALRTVWTIPTQPMKSAHFATFPESLVKPCILAGCPPNGIVLDTFMGSGTTALVAAMLGRRFVGTELNPDYIKIAHKRLGLFAAMGDENA